MTLSDTRTLSPSLKPVFLPIVFLVLLSLSLTSSTIEGALLLIFSLWIYPELSCLVLISLSHHHWLFSLFLYHYSIDLPISALYIPL